MDNRERRGYDNDVKRLLDAVFGNGGNEGLRNAVFNLIRNVDRMGKDLHELEQSVQTHHRFAETQEIQFRDHPLLSQDAARKVVNHVNDAEKEEASRGVFFSRLQGQAIILVFSIIQTVILGWVAVHIVPLPVRLGP